MIENTTYYQMMVKEIETIEEEVVQTFAFNVLQQVPEYFFTVPASSSGKYHPKNDLGEGGLVRHSISVKRVLDYLLELEIYSKFTDHQKNLLRVAALFHDCLKSGTQDDYAKSNHTNFYHPVLASNFIITMSVKLNFDFDDAKFIANAIISHMGQWNTSVKTTGALPKPETDEQKLLHLADFIASRKDINLELNEKVQEKKPEWNLKFYD